MTRLPARFIEDRALRDAARAVLDADIARLRASLDEQGLASRVSSGMAATATTRIRAGASDVLEQARTRAGDYPGVLALLVGAILLWLMRAPLLAMLAGDDAGDEAGDIPDSADSDTNENGQEHDGDVPAPEDTATDPAEAFAAAGETL